MGSFSTVTELAKQKRVAEMSLTSAQSALNKAIEDKKKFTYELGQRMMHWDEVGIALPLFKRDTVKSDENYTELQASTDKHVLWVRIFPFKQDDLFTVLLRDKEGERGVAINIQRIETIGRIVKRLIENLER